MHFMSTIIVHDEHDKVIGQYLSLSNFNIKINYYKRIPILLILTSPQQVLQAIYTDLGVMSNPEVHTFDESHGGPGREYRTVLDELEISDNVISNALGKVVL